jgi:hypothetical protein
MEPALTGKPVPPPSWAEGRRFHVTTTPPRVTRRRIVQGLALGAAALPFQVGAQNPAPRRVDVALVLAVDCSRSIDEGEYRLQAQGYADAFRTDRVQRAALSGRHGAIAVILTQWGGQFAQKEATPWTLLDGKPALTRFADKLAGLERLVDDDATSIGAAIDHGRRMLERIPFLPERRVIDVSGDGMNNQGRFPRYARDDAVAAGIGINALAILSDHATLDRYFRAEVIGGPGAFVVPARRFADFGPAIANKIAMEVA